MADLKPPRIGVGLPSHGPNAMVTTIDAARRAEQLGFDSVWISDHVVMVDGAASPYPFDAEGEITWSIDAPMSDALIALTAAGAVTTTIELGTCVLIAPMRNPLVLAKQVATLDVLTGGRFTLGVGVGWLAEEFAALGVPFDGRGTRLNEWMAILRDCWTGRPRARSYEHWNMPPGVRCYPTPGGEVPILAGGMSKAALRRVGRHADGWVAFGYTDEIDPEEIRAGIRVIEAEAALAGRPAPTRMALQAPGPVEPLAARLADLVSAGLTEIIVSANWAEPEDVRTGLELLRRSAP